MKIYIVGSGGVGGYLGGLLAKAGNDVTFVARGDHFQVLKTSGLMIKSVIGDFSVIPVQVINKISDVSQPDLVIFTVKTYDTEKAAEELTKVVTKETIIITFQNGVDNDERIKKHIFQCSVYPGVAFIISTKMAPGVITQTGGLRKFLFGDKKNSQIKKLQEVEKIMRESKIDATCSNDITRDLWKKFMFIVAFSGMTAVCRSPIGKVLSHPFTKSLYERCVKEAIEVAKALNISIAEDAFTAIMTISSHTAPLSKSSLLVDIEMGHRNEIETLNGTLVRFAKEKLMDVPINELIYGAIKSLN